MGKSIVTRLLQISPGPAAQSVASPTADPGVTSLISAWSHTLAEIEPEIISTVIFRLPLIQDGLSVSSESMCTEYWLTTLSSLSRKKFG